MANSSATGRGDAPDPTAATDNNADPQAVLLAERAAAYVDQLEHEIESVKGVIAGAKETLASKQAELKQARAAVRDGA